MRNNIEWLNDILEAVAKIEKYESEGKRKFVADELIQVWMIHQFQVIGEAANKISDDVKSKASSVRWREIVAMRNFIVHEYFGIDKDEIWNTIKKDIPILKKEITKLINLLSRS